ncbi:ROK family protein [Dictyobacter arantiisoli]|uniref:Xylose repressor protein n=1 Tax=Dictyobacter arantiisoli TaxID=2014874 RepID=A0A5A5TAR8_9CHLR|nr:ROK family protein [Dictyobacter arantiisoli]GCF08103.1 xylose repressor protein [Dictyobacter arantiisoli]
MYRNVPPVDRKLMQKINQNTLLNLIRIHAPISRTDLKRLSGLSQGTIFGMTMTLLEQQLIVEKGMAKSTGGRKAELLEIDPDGRYSIGIKLSEYAVTIVLLNMHGEIIYKESYATTLYDNAAHAVQLIINCMESFFLHISVPREKILGIGCAVFGPVHQQSGRSVDTWILHWHNVELGPPLQRHFGLPVIVANDVDCLLCYEKMYGHGRDYHDLLLISVGRGLGMAALIHDLPFRGAQGMGAEFGHAPFDIFGRTCGCGNQGCYEAYVANHGILRTYQELHPSAWDPSLTTCDLAQRALEGDEMACQAFTLTGTYLGAGIAGLVNVFNPECILINGSDEFPVDLIMPAMKETLMQHIFSQLGKDLDIVIMTRATQELWAQSAGCLILQDFFSSPDPF